MSYTESHVGKIKKVDLEGLSVEDWAKEVANSYGMELTKYYDSYTELVLDELHFRYILVEEEVYEIIEDREFTEEDISELTPEGDGVFSFVMQFYNGGTCLTEMLTDAVKQHNRGRQF